MLMQAMSIASYVKVEEAQPQEVKRLNGQYVAATERKQMEKYP